MKLQDEAPFHMKVSQDFWLLWLIAVPLTVVVLVIWRVCYMGARERLVDNMPRSAPGYLGWNTLKQTLRGENGKEKGQYTITTREVTSDV